MNPLKAAFLIIFASSSFVARSIEIAGAHEYDVNPRLREQYPNGFRLAFATS